MKRELRSAVQCQGGLGNQLFQLSLALYVNQGKAVELDFVMKDSKDELKIQNGLDSYVLPSSTGIRTYKSTHFLTNKGLNFATRLSTYSTKSGKYRALIFMKRAIVSTYNLVNFTKRDLFVNDGTGYSKFVHSDSKPRKYIGYFQSYRWMENPIVRKQLMNLELKQKSKWVEQYIGYAQKEIPLVVHVRLGDYLHEEKIGIPTTDFYKNGIDLLWNQGKFTTIWIFTNDETKARLLLGEIKAKKTRWITDNQENAAHNLEVMRLGHGYVISNSTFSWWGAFLSRNPNSPVVAPKKWFIGMEDPLDLCPPSWIRI